MFCCLSFVELLLTSRVFQSDRSESNEEEEDDDDDDDNEESENESTRKKKRKEMKLNCVKYNSKNFRLTIFLVVDTISQIGVEVKFARIVALDLVTIQKVGGGGRGDIVGSSTLADSCPQSVDKVGVDGRLGERHANDEISQDGYAKDILFRREKHSLVF